MCGRPNEITMEQSRLTGDDPSEEGAGVEGESEWWEAYGASQVVSLRPSFIRYARPITLRDVEKHIREVGQESWCQNSLMSWRAQNQQAVLGLVTGCVTQRALQTENRTTRARSVASSGPEGRPNHRPRCQWAWGQLCLSFDMAVALSSGSTTYEQLRAGCIGRLASAVRGRSNCVCQKLLWGSFANSLARSGHSTGEESRKGLSVSVCKSQKYECIECLST